MKRVLSSATVLLVLCTLLLQSVGCGGGNNDTINCDSKDYPPELKPFVPIVEAWIYDYIDEISDEIGALVTANLPVARDIASAVVKKAITKNLQCKIIEAEARQSGQEHDVRVRLAFPLEFDLPKLPTKAYNIEVDYILRVREGSVVDSNIDLDSFHI